MKTTKNFTPLRLNKGMAGEITFNNDQEYYQYFNENTEKKPYIKIGGKEIPMQTDQFITLKDY